MHYLILVFCFFFASSLLGSPSKKNKEREGYVSVKLKGQLGNQLFEIATAYAYSLDHNLFLTVPDLVHNNKDGIPYNAKNLFLFKIDSYDLPYSPQVKWEEPSFNYTKIPNADSLELRGFFQSEKYFKHRRTEILELFASPQGLNEEILAKYPFLDSESLVVGVQIRDYQKEIPSGKGHPTVGRSYYEKAVARFPKDTIFLVSSNNPNYAKNCMQGLSDNIIYLQGDYIEEFYTLVLCKSFIISNSSFGWWASWLSTDPNKTIIVPSPWFSKPYHSQSMERDLFPSGCTIIDYKKKQ